MWLSATRQRWKLAVAVCGATVTLASFAWFIRELNVGAKVGLPLATFTIAGVFAVSWLVFAIRCPRCGYRPTVHFMRTESFDTWFVKLVAMERCPKCGGTE